MQEENVEPLALKAGNSTGSHPEIESAFPSSTVSRYVLCILFAILSHSKERKI